MNSLMPHLQEAATALAMMIKRAHLRSKSRASDRAYKQEDLQDLQRQRL